MCGHADLLSTPGRLPSPLLLGSPVPELLAVEEAVLALQLLNLDLVTYLYPPQPNSG